MAETRCLNCNHILAAEDDFCPKCGQSTRSPRFALRELFAEFYQTLFNVDNRLWRTLRLMFIPAALPLEWVGGKRIRYLHPVRTFIVATVVAISLLAILSGKISDEFEPYLVKMAAKQEVYQNLDSLRGNPVVDQFFSDSLHRKVFPQALVDKKLDISGGILDMDVEEQYEIPTEDILKLDADFLIEKYKIESIWSKLILKQFFKINMDGRGALNFMIGNVFWILIAIMLSTGFILKLLYIRKNYYLSEHIVLSANCHTVMLAFVIVVSIFGLMASETMLKDMIPEDLVGRFILVAMLIFAIFLLASMKRYYGQSWSKTMWKMLSLMMLYGFSLTLFALLGIFLSLAFF